MALWAYHLTNLALAALLYTLLGRLALTLLLGPDSGNFIHRAFVRLTDPVVAPVRVVTPQAVPHALLLLFAAVWLILARLGLAVSFAASGWLSAPGPGAGA